MQPDLQLLLRQSREGDHRAFSEVVEHYQPYAYALALRLVTDEDDALDIVQETFIRVWKHLPRFDAERSFTTWLYRIVTNLGIDHIRRRHRLRLTPLTYEVDGMRSEHQSPLSVCSNAELVRIIRSLTQDLPLKQRIVFTLRDLHDLSVDEVAEITGLSVASVKTNLHFARKHIRGALITKYRIVEASL